MNILAISILGAILGSIGLSMAIVSSCILLMNRVDPKIRTFDFEKTEMKFIKEK